MRSNTGTKARSKHHHELTESGFVEYSSRKAGRPHLKRAAIAKFVIGVEGDGIVVTLEKQPGHEPTTFIQELGVDRGKWGSSRERIHPTGTAYRIESAVVGTLLSEALQMDILPGGIAAIELYSSYFKNQPDVQGLISGNPTLS